MAELDYFVPDTESGLSPDVVSAYLNAYTKAGDWVVDPFCQSSAIVTQAVASGRSVIAISANPLDVLRVRISLAPLPARDLGAAITRLADSLKSGTTLRQHLTHLYRTLCPLCAGEAMADYFVWERGGLAPVQASYRCTACGASGMRHCDSADGEIASQIPSRGLYYWHLVDRVAKGHGDDRKLAEELLDLYTPRNLYALSNLLLKIEDTWPDSAVREALQAQLLECLERGTKLQPVPGEPETSQSAHLQPPERYAEWNIWHLLDDAVERTSGQRDGSMKLDTSLAQALAASSDGQTPRVFVGHMTVRALVQALGEQRVRLIIGQPPIPGRQQWALPYLWTGCLYGHAEAGALWAFLEKRSSYWWWYARAVQATLRAFRPVMHADGHIVLAGVRKDVSFHEAMALAAAGADLRTESVVLQLPLPRAATRPFASVPGNYRLLLTPSPAGPRWTMDAEQVLQRLGDVTVEAAEQVLQETAEPVSFARLHCGIWQALAQRGVLQRVVDLVDTPGSPLELARDRVRTALQKQVGEVLAQLWADAKKERCLWWLSNPPAAGRPLSERVEETVYELLLRGEEQPASELLEQVYQRFPGSLTPDLAWIEACLHSYGLQNQLNTWGVSPGDRPEQQTLTRRAIVSSLADVGRRLGLDVRQSLGDVDVAWMAEDGSRYLFVILLSAGLSRLTQRATGLTDARKYAVVGSARQELVRARLTFSPDVGEVLTRQGWQLMAQASVEQWQARPEVKLSDIEYLVIQDLLDAYSRPHLPLL